jgi:GMP synthase (glutamine-hydrolysing)
LGAEVGRNPQKEIGWKEVLLTEEGKTDPVLKNFVAGEKIFHWHSDQFEIPKGAVHLAYSQLCENQAFRFGSKIYGFQFHLEVDEPMVERWLKVPERLEELHSISGNNESQTILKETAQNITRLKQLSAQTFGAFIQNFGTPKKHLRLSSKH